ncbi:MAG: amidophosphoribosyltransferase [Bacteroidales bacterium]|nr:amidophosphoribosyltransferase [Bacteroidales bacterium]MDY6075881.1 amidophosphoribosyltransferase [Bacteroidales bacterium]
MSGFFGIVSKRPCITDLFYGIDYHSHLGTSYGGICTYDGNTFNRSIHSLKGSYFRTKFESDLPKFKGNSGIGVISDTDSQPIVVNSHLGKFALVTVAKIANLAELEKECLDNKLNFTELSRGVTNQTELIAILITQGKDFVDGIQNVYKKVKGSVSMLLLTEDGIIAARDFYGRTPIVIGKDNDGYVAAFESHSYINLEYETVRFIGPGEIVKITSDGLTQLLAPNDKMQICSFLWIYYGFPASDYDNINIEEMRYRGGFSMGKDDDIEADYVAPIPDSGIGMAIGYSHGSGIPYTRSVVKYTPTWSRSFMPVSQEQREHVAKMKLIPNHSLLKGKRVVFCDDSIVRGTQLRDNVKMLYDYGAKEVHIRISCPPLIYGCNFLNFSASKNELELISRRCIEELEGGTCKNLQLYCDHTTKEYAALVEMIRKHIGVDTLKFNTIDNICNAIGMPKCNICTHCFDGSSYGDK